ncbi:unnamed protein product [Phaedon cochleariae]|uniref:CRAL-TRIO domain-containing protein n=1 Tax=Phaedon cochleariae TaxID=80249 RepID=A0A9P0DEK7_PHACE|nr:unnamed protein product [Phaedon cochleariae]
MPLTEIDVEHLYEKDIDLKKEDVCNLLKWKEKQLHLPVVTELQLALFLHSCHYSTEKAKRTIDMYFTIKTMSPQIFGNRLPSNPMVQAAINCVLFIPLPDLTPEGDLILFVKMMDTDPENYHYGTQINCFDMITLLHLHQHGPAKGVIIVFDMKGFAFGHFLKVNVAYMKTFLYYLQEGMPIRFKSIQFFNIVPFMDKVLALMKPFMEREVAESLVMHTKIESLYKYVPQKILPEEYGGSSDTLEILHEKYRAQMNENEDFFKFQESQIVDESKRLDKENYVGDIFGVNGTFKKLQVD